jgi:hypothetical protein
MDHTHAAMKARPGRRCKPLEQIEQQIICRSSRSRECESDEKEGSSNRDRLEPITRMRRRALSRVPVAQCLRPARQPTYSRIHCAAEWNLIQPRLLRRPVLAGRGE